MYAESLVAPCHGAKANHHLSWAYNTKAYFLKATRCTIQLRMSFIIRPLTRYRVCKYCDSVAFHSAADYNKENERKTG